jgi:nitroimidazol reductase NimA-like FMN-containing flavoprotein (pyridoxamine 5'-phosphate oxidase superfamily)
MVIQELRNQDNLNLLAHMHFGRIACAQGAQPYVVPSYFAYQNNYLYSFATIGQRVEWMRANPLVCVETDEVLNSEEWVSIIIFGRYEELPNTPEWKMERELAYKLLKQKANWWEPGYAKTIIRDTTRSLDPVYFRIQIVQITGHHGTRDPRDAIDAKSRAIEHTDKHSIHNILGVLQTRLFSK